jgi:hypothetical protein
VSVITTIRSMFKFCTVPTADCATASEILTGCGVY